MQCPFLMVILMRKKEERWFVAISLHFVDFTYRKP